MLLDEIVPRRDLVVADGPVDRDALFRVRAEVEAVLPQRLFDKSNVPSGKGWTGDVDYKASYRELWGR